MDFPEPQTIPEYQKELLRLWGAYIRVEDKARKLVEVAQTALEEVEIMRHRAHDLIDTITRIKKERPT